VYFRESVKNRPSLAIIGHKPYNIGVGGDPSWKSKGHSMETKRILRDKTKPFEDGTTLPKGTTLQERYEIIRTVGIGGMGAVYQARDKRFTKVARLCAVKEMVNSAPDPHLRELSIKNFEREANILATLSHPAIPKIFDCFSEGSRSYLVMEFIEGQDLESLLQRTASFLPEEQVISWAIQTCDVLSYMHSHKPNPIIFRDVKPSNIILSSQDRIVVIDFGIAKVFQTGQKGTMIGTEGYSPPEQYKGIADPRGDIYALGATMHHLLTKRDPRLEPPFTFHESPPRSLNPEVSERLEAVVMKALQYEIEDRYSSAEEMKLALQTILIAQGGSSATPGTAAFISDKGVLPVWEFVCEDEVRSSPTVAEGIVYVGSYDNNLYALDAKTGQFIWKYATEGGVASSPRVWRDVVLVGSEDRVFYAINARTGGIAWTCPTGGRIRSSPQVEYDHVFFGSDEGYLYAVSAQSGRVAWKFQALKPIRSSPAIGNDVIYFGSDDNHVYALDIQTGNLKWKYRTNRGVTSSPAVDEGLVYVGSTDWNVYALDAQSGWAIWRYRTNNAVTSSPAISEGCLYIGSVDGNLYALDANSGQLIWRFSAEGQITSSPAVAEGGVYFGSVDGHVYSVDVKTGKLRWSFKTGGPVPSSPSVADGVVYIGSTDSKIYALLM
jgi:outer membrane protein assembly factor BamB/predicted Ser/Thr protein kinase